MLPQNEQAASFLTSLLLLFASTAEVLHAKVLLAAEQCLPEQQRDEHQDASEAAAQQAQDVEEYEHVDMAGCAEASRSFLRAVPKAQAKEGPWHVSEAEPKAAEAQPLQSRAEPKVAEAADSAEAEPVVEAEAEPKPSVAKQSDWCDECGEHNNICQCPWVSELEAAAQERRNKKALCWYNRLLAKAQSKGSKSQWKGSKSQSQGSKSQSKGSKSKQTGTSLQPAPSPSPPKRKRSDAKAQSKGWKFCQSKGWKFVPSPPPHRPPAEAVAPKMVTEQYKEPKEPQRRNTHHGPDMKDKQTGRAKPVVVDVIKGNSGICAQMFAERGFGFVIPDDGSDDVFVLYKHNPGLEGIDRGGAAVTFDKEWDVGRGKYRGINCKVKGGGGGGKADGDAYLEPEQSNQMVKGRIKRGVVLANFYENHDAYKGPRKWR